MMYFGYNGPSLAHKYNNSVTFCLRKRLSVNCEPSSIRFGPEPETLLPNPNLSVAPAPAVEKISITLSLSRARKP